MTEYFRQEVLRKRPYIQLEWCLEVMQDPVFEQLQPDGRFRLWGYISSLQKYLRVVTLQDRETLHNAFPDRRFQLEKVLLKR